MSNLTSVQERALALDRNISVTAGAGSGKTRILVERYLKIVLNDPRKVRRVIAFTFTNKAAGEMQERVAEAVNERLEAEPENHNRLKLLAVRDQLNSAAISTIHSFCAKVLREFPIEAGLSPDFSEMDDMRQLILKQEAIDRVFQKVNHFQDREEKAKWLFLFSHISRKVLSEMLFPALAAPYDMNRIVRRFNGLSEDEYIDFISNQWLEIVKGIFGEIDYRPFAESIQPLLATDSGKKKNQKGQDTLSELIHIHQLLNNETDEISRYGAILRLADLLTTKNGTAYKNAGQLGGNESWDAASVALLVRLSAVCAPYAEKLRNEDPGPPPDETDRLWFRLFQIFLEMYAQVSGQYKELKEDAGLVDFEDLQLLTLHLLSNNARVRDELVRRYDYILVDEFQDTDNLQWEIIRYLAGGPETLKADKVFVVGDPKQSIYGFRSADIRIFREIKALFARQAGAPDTSSYSGNVVFVESFRFLPRLNGFINFLFDRILQETEDNPFEVGFHPLKAMRDLPGKGKIELAILESEDERVEAEAEYVAQKIKSIIREGQTCFKWQGSEQELPVACGDIAILLRQRTHLQEIEQALRKYDIPFKTAGGIGFWQKQEIFDFYHLLRFITNPKDDFSLVGILRSKMFLLSDTALFLLTQADGRTCWDRLKNFHSIKFPDQTDYEIIRAGVPLISKWLALRDRIPLDQLLHKIMDDLQFSTVLAAQLNGEQLIANINKLIDQAHSLSMTGSGGLQDFLNHLDDVIDREMREGEALVTLEDKGTVKIMTIHAAKGLQFPVVFLPFLNSKLKGRQSQVFIDGELGLATKLNTGIVKGERDDHTLLNILKYRQRQKEVAEAKRLFYVAATRASNHLILSAGIRKGAAPGKDSVLSWIREGFNPDQIDIFSSEDIEHENFKLQICRNPVFGFKPEAAFPTVDQDTKALAKQIEGLQPDPENVPEYLVPITQKIKGQVFSATRIMTFLNNPEEYYHRYHLGFFEQDYDSFGDDVFKTDHSLLKGKILHRFLELAGQGAVDADRLLPNILFEFDVFEGDLSQDLIREIKDLIQQCYQSEYASEVLKAAEYKNEISVTTRLDDAYFTGTLDRLYKNPDGNWEVVDYKTNRISGSRVAMEAEKYTWQIKAYAFLLSRLFPKQAELPVSFYFIQPDRLYRKIFSQTECLEIEGDIKQTICEINKRFPPKLY